MKSFYKKTPVGFLSRTAVQARHASPAFQPRQRRWFTLDSIQTDILLHKVSLFVYTNSTSFLLTADGIQHGALVEAPTVTQTYEELLKATKQLGEWP